jgi:Ca2+:H+ antiporter
MTLQLPKQRIYYLLVFAVAAIIANFAGADDTLVFILAAAGLIPLAKLVGDATEELAIYTGPRIGGLLNATLGNAAELIITIFAIQRGLLDLVRASIAGSIIGNLLIVLGLSLLLGGLKNGVQIFDRRQAGLNATLVVLSVVALAIPSLFDPQLATNPETELIFNEGVAIVLIILYALSLIYAFTTGGVSGHSDHGDSHAAPKGKKAAQAAANATPANTPSKGEIAIVRAPAAEVHAARWTLQFSVIMLLIATVGTAFVSEALVGAVEHVGQTLGLTEIFLGLIIIPLVGNVAEHLVAVQVAIKNKMELSLAVSLGSSLQIAMFVTPVLVFVALLFNQRLLLVFTTPELIALIGTSMIAAFIALDGESNWLEGAMLIAIYIIIALAFLFLPDAAHEGAAAGEALRMLPLF